MVRVHPRTLRIYEEEGFLAPARTPTNIRLYSDSCRNPDIQGYEVVHRVITMWAVETKEKLY